MSDAGEERADGGGEPGDLVVLCRLEELEGGSPLPVRTGPIDVVVVRVGDVVFAIEDRCTHQGTPLSEGIVSLEDCSIECWKHGSVFDLRTGEARSLPAREPARVFDVVLRGDDVCVRSEPGF